MHALRFIGWAILAGTAATGTAHVYGQAYPNKAVRIVTSGVGGMRDFAARLVAQGISGGLGQQVVVDNRPSGVIPGEIVAKAQPDGYTLLLYGSVIWLTPLLRDNVPYDPVRDFAPITLAVSSPNVLVVHPSLPAKSVKELIALAKAKPGELNIGMSGAGSSGHLAGELFKAMAGIKMVSINYKGAGAVLNDLMAGQVQLTFATATSVTGHLKSGRLRALAVTSAHPTTLFPGLPTVAAAGLPGYESASTSGIFAPARTPDPIIRRLNQEIVQALNRADLKAKFFNSGSEVVASSPEQLAATIKADLARMGKVISDAGIRVE